MSDITFESTGLELLEDVLSQYNFAVEPRYDSKENVTYCKLGGNGRNALNNAIKKIHHGNKVLQVSTEENYWLIINGDKLYLDCEDLNNIITLDQSVINLSNSVKDNGYGMKRKYCHGKINFSLSGGKGIDTLSDLIWEAEQGKNDVVFESVPYYDHQVNVLKRLDVYSSENFIVKYLNDELIDA